LHVLRSADACATFDLIRDFHEPLFAEFAIEKDSSESESESETTSKVTGFFFTKI
jgi:hypothetical protein